MNCAISGVVPAEPVVTKDGIVFEKRLIMKVISQNGTCPVTNKGLAAEDLIEINGTNYSKPKQPSETSIPNTLLSLQNEFDAVMIETFELKKQYLELQTQLSNCLYENDAAKRVIARLLAERDHAKKALLNYQAQQKPEKEQDVEMDVSEPLPESVQQEMDKVYASLFEQRRTKKKESINIELLSSYQPKTHKTIGTAKLQRVTTIDVFESFTLAGALDGSVTIVDQQGKQVSTIKAHKKEIVANNFVDHSHFLTAGDQELKYWSFEKKNTKPKQEWSVKSNATSINIHPCGKYFITTSSVGYELGLIENGESVAIKRIPSGLSCGRVHPDGLIFGTGNEKGVVSIYDLKTNTKAFELEVFEDAVTGVSFSENGYHMCSWSTISGKVVFFDLRKVADTKEVLYSMSVPGVCQVRFEPSGKYVGISDEKSVRLFQVKKWEQVWELEVERSTDFQFGPGCEFVAVAFDDRRVSIYSP